MRKRRQEVILVSSGAIALGRRHLGVSPGKLKLEESQAAAAVGQIRLAHAYKEILEAREITVAQILSDPGRHRATPPLSECPRDLEYAARLGRGAGDQRERYRCDRGDPLWRQRPAGGAGGANDRRGLPGAAVGYRRAVYSEPATRTRTRQFISRVLDITPAIEAMAGGSGSEWERAACRPRSRPRRSRWAQDAICASPREPMRIP